MWGVGTPPSVEDLRYSEKYNKREVLSTGGLSGWWVLAILCLAKRAWALTQEWALSIRLGERATWALTISTQRFTQSTMAIRHIEKIVMTQSWEEIMSFVSGFRRMHI